MNDDESAVTTQQAEHNIKSRPKGIVAPYGLLHLYLKLHRHLVVIQGQNSFSSSGIQLHRTLDSKHQSWMPVFRNPLDYSSMREVTLLILSHESTIKNLHPR